MSKSRSRSRTSYGETKGQRTARSFLAFVLFLIFTGLSLVACVRIAFISPKSITGVFSNERYVTSLREDILNYSQIMLERNMLPEEILDDTVSYEKVYAISYAYAAGMTGASQDYNETAYQELVSELRDEIRTALDDAVKRNDIPVDKRQVKEGSAQLADTIQKHILACVEKPYMDRVVQALKIGKTATLIAAIALAVLAVLLMLIIVSIGDKRYRAMRSVVHALNAAALMDLLLVGGEYVIEQRKTLYIFPTYFRASLMEYVHHCTGAVAVAALVLFLAAVTLTVVIWKLNRDTKK